MSLRNNVLATGKGSFLGCADGNPCRCRPYRVSGESTSPGRDFIRSERLLKLHPNCHYATITSVGSPQEKILSAASMIARAAQRDAPCAFDASDRCATHSSLHAADHSTISCSAPGCRRLHAGKSYPSRKPLDSLESFARTMGPESPAHVLAEGCIRIDWKRALTACIDERYHPAVIT